MRKSRFAGLDLVDDKKRHWVPKPDLVELADAICEAYIAQRPQFVPGRVTIPKASLKQFYDAAQLCRAEGLTAEQYVYRALQAMSLTGNFWPSGIAKQREVELTHHQQWSETISSYTARIANCNARLKIYDPRLLVADEQLDITPLMRFVLARDLGMTDLMARYKQAALMEYRGSPAAAELFQGLKGVLGV